MLIAFPLQQWLHDCTSVTLYVQYIAFRVSVDIKWQYIGNAGGKHVNLRSEFWKTIYVSFSCPTHKYILPDDDLLRSKHGAAVKYLHT